MYVVWRRENCVPVLPVLRPRPSDTKANKCKGYGQYGQQPEHSSDLEYNVGIPTGTS